MKAVHCCLQALVLSRLEGAQQAFLNPSFEVRGGALAEIADCKEINVVS